MTASAPRPRFPRADLRALLWLLLLLALAAAVRTIGVDYALWYDEVASTKFAAVPLAWLWSPWMARETNPPLYYSLLHGWMALVGDTDARLRLLSVAIGLTGILAAWRIGRDLAGATAGLAAAGLLAVSAQHVLYSQQVRGYMLGHAAALWAVAATLAFLRRAEAPAEAGPRRAALLAYVPACTIAVYSHTMIILLPALINAYVLLKLLLVRGRPRPWAALAEWVAANAAVALLWAWWGLITLQQAGHASNIRWIGRPSLAYSVRMTLESFAPSGFGPASLAAAALVGALALWGAWATRRRDGLLLLVIAAGAPVLLFALSFKTPVFMPRTVYFAAGSFLVLAACGIAAIPHRAGRLAALAAVLAAQLAGLAIWWPHREIEPWPEIVAQLDRIAPHAPVVTKGKGVAFALARYCRPTTCDLSIRTLPEPLADGWASGFAPIQPLDAAGLPALVRSAPRLESVDWIGEDPGPAIAAAGGRLSRPSAIASPTRNIVVDSWSPP